MDLKKDEIDKKFDEIAEKIRSFSHNEMKTFLKSVVIFFWEHRITAIVVVLLILWWIF